MNWLDIVILCLIGAGLIKGLFDGMIKQAVSVVALIIGIYLCSGVAKWLIGYLQQLEWFPQHLALWTSYILGFCLIVGIILFVGRIVSRLIDATPLSIFNHLIGGVAGVILMVLMISFLLNLIEILDPQSTIISQEIKVESRLYYAAKNIIPSVFPGNLFEIKEEIIELLH